jgi:hypothetical protein
LANWFVYASCFLCFVGIVPTTPQAISMSLFGRSIPRLVLDSLWDRYVRAKNRNFKRCSDKNQCCGSGFFDSGFGSSILAESLNTNPDPDSGFWWPKIGKNYTVLKQKLIPICLMKISFNLSIGLHKGQPSYWRTLQPSKENIQHYMKFLNFLFLWLMFAFLNPDPDPQHLKAKVRPLLVFVSFYFIRWYPMKCTVFVWSSFLCSLYTPLPVHS